LTAEAYGALAPPGRSELVQGEVVDLTPAGSSHGRIAALIAEVLGAFVRPRRLGVVLTADAGFILARNPDTVRAPDVAVVLQGRIPAGGLPEGFFPGPPDLAVEVVSPWDRWLEVEGKVEELLAAGTREAWVVDPRHATVRTFAGTRAAVRVLGQGDTLSTELLPGFALPVDELFG
jgi:Uma2 family endonuclease